MFDGWADIPICGKILLSYSTQLPLRYINIIIFTLPSYVLLIIPSISLSLMVTPCYLLMFQIPMLFSSYPKFFLMNSSWKPSTARETTSPVAMAMNSLGPEAVIASSRASAASADCCLWDGCGFIYMCWLVQWIGLRENLQETIDFPIKYGAFL